jgi:hypothetical protein
MLDLDPGVVTQVHRLEGSSGKNEELQAQAQEIAVPRGVVHVVP